jgi:two-component system repressor protein LuxO
MRNALFTVFVNNRFSKHAPWSAASMRPGRRSDAAPRLLLIERDPAARRIALASLVANLPAGCDLAEAASGRSGAERLRAESFEIVLADLGSLSDLGAPIEEAVTRIVRLAEGALVIALSDGASVSAAVAAMRAGAHDFIPKPISGSTLGARIAELGQRHGKSHALALDAPSGGEADFAGFVGSSSQMRVVYEQIERIAPSSAPVFITGESGTGKEVCADALHRRGPRAAKPFVAINCAAIPRELMETELFGATRGAFTGAHEDRRGAAEVADGGTLFLDEIGEMDLSLQAKLLRFLQTGTVTRVGDAAARPVDVRVVCATNRNPMQLISQKRFREDLFYRLHVLPIHLPPLRQRPADIVTLARHFLGRYGAEEGKIFGGIAGATADFLVGRDWPGNVRQLQNLIRRITVMFDGGPVTPEMAAAADIESRGLKGDVEETQTPGAILPMWLQEQRIIEDAVARFAGNVALAAAALQISPSTIYRKRQGWAEMGGERGAA